MEMNQIRYFLAVCQHRNFTHAASASNVSQPSLTTAIKKLEHELGGDQRWTRLVRQFGGLAKVDRVGFYAANFSIISAVA